MASIPDRYKRDDQEFDRAVAFIDATFAVALTLLVTTLDLSSDPKSWDNLGDFYDAIGSQFVAFGVSFLIIAGYWLAHYRLFSTFTAIDIKLIVANLVMLAAIVLLPFTSESAGDPNIDHLPLPVAVLAVNVAAVSAAFTLLYVVAERRKLLREEPTRKQVFWNTLGLLAPSAVFLLSVPIAYAADSTTARLFWLTLVPVNAYLGYAAARAGDPI